MLASLSTSICVVRNLDHHRVKRRYEDMALKAFALASVFVLLLTTISSSAFSWPEPKLEWQDVPFFDAHYSAKDATTDLITLFGNPTTENKNALEHTITKILLQEVITDAATGAIVAGTAITVGVIVTAPISVPVAALAITGNCSNWDLKLHGCKCSSRRSNHICGTCY